THAGYWYSRKPPVVLPVRIQAGCVEDRAFVANPTVVPAVRRANLGDAAEADADAAGHRRFQREMTRSAPAPGEGRQGLQHRLRAAADQVAWRCVLFEELRDEATEAKAAVVAGQVDRGAGGAEILHSRRQVGRAHAVIERHALGGLPGQSGAVATAAEQLPDVRQEWRLADAARDEANMIEAIQLGEAVAQWPPHFDAVS